MWTLGCSHHTGSVSVTDNKNLSVKVRKNVQLVFQHCCKMNLMATLRFLLVEAYLATIQVVAGFKNLLQKVESGPFFCNKIFTCCAFYRPKANSFCS